MIAGCLSADPTWGWSQFTTCSLLTKFSFPDCFMGLFELSPLPLFMQWGLDTWIRYRLRYWPISWMEYWWSDIGHQMFNQVNFTWNCYFSNNVNDIYIQYVLLPFSNNVYVRYTVHLFNSWIASVWDDIFSPGICIGLDRKKLNQYMFNEDWLFHLTGQNWPSLLLFQPTESSG